MDHLGQKRKAAADDDEVVVKPRKLNRIHNSLLLREVEGTSAMWMQKMISRERMQRIEQYILKPIMEEDMPGLLDVEEVEDRKYIQLGVESSSFGEYFPDIIISWDSDRFRAAGNMTSFFENTFRGHKKATTQIAIRNLHTASPTLVVHGISTIEDLIRLVPAMRTMASVVFRDVWLVHLLHEERSWSVQNYTINLRDSDGKLIRMDMEVYSSSSKYSVSIKVLTPTSSRQGVVRVKPRSPVEVWRERLVQLGCDPTAEKLRIDNYNSHADASRVIDALRVLLQP